MNRTEDGGDGLGLTFGTEHLSLAIGLGAKYCSLSITLCSQDRGLLLAAGGQNL